MTNTNITKSLKITTAGKGWYRIWRGSDLVAAVPSKRMLNQVLDAMRAEEDLAIARAKIALLEGTLDLELRCSNPLLSLMRMAR
jgi:hypothetical protein